MMSLAARSGVFSPYMQATAHAVAGPLKSLVPGVVVKSDKVLTDVKKTFLCQESLQGLAPRTGLAVSVSINGRAGFRFAHTDVRTCKMSDHDHQGAPDPQRSRESRHHSCCEGCVNAGDFGGHSCPCHGSH